ERVGPATVLGSAQGPSLRSRNPEFWVSRMITSRHLALVPSDSVQLTGTGWSVEDFAEASRSEGTRKAYRASLKAFAAWCNEQGCSSLPAAPEVVARYFTSMAIAGKKLATIHRAKAAID